MHAPLPRQAGEKEFVLLMALLMSAVAFAVDGTLPAMAAIGHDLRASYDNQTHHIINCFFAGMALGQLLAGMASDAYGRKPVLFAGLAVYLCGAIICREAEGMATMLLGRSLQGAGAAGPYIMVMSIVRDRYQGRAMARIMSFTSGVFIMTPVLAPIFGQAVLKFGDWRDIFTAYMLYAAFAGIWAWLRLRESLPKEKRTARDGSDMAKSLRKAASNRNLWRFTLALGCIFAGLTGYLNTAQQMFQGIYGVGDKFALYFGAQALATGAGSFLNGALVKRLGMRHTCLVASAAVTLISAAFLCYIVASAPSFGLFFAYGVAFLLCFGFLYGNLNALALESAGGVAGAASALLGATATVCGAGVGAVIGQLYDGTLLPVVAGFVAMGAIAFLLVAGEKRAPGDGAAGAA